LPIKRQHHFNVVEKRKEEVVILRVRGFPSLTLVLMGYMDWFTTIIGISYFGAVEINPLMAELTQTNLAAFTAVKLTSSIFVGLLYYQGEKMLQRLEEKKSKSFLRARTILRTGFVVATVVLLSAVINNIFVISKTA
jgi:Na+/H+ antiporter NhaD/arsenite permease-like protein